MYLFKIILEYGVEGWFVMAFREIGTTLTKSIILRT